MITARSMNTDPGKEISFKDDKENPDEKLIKLIDGYDMNMLRYLAKLYEALNGEKMDFEKIKTAVDALQQFNTRQEYNYLNNLLHPEKCKAVKIPSPIPVPSCSFQLHNCLTLRTNASGNLALVFNPFFLGSTDALVAKELAVGDTSVNIQPKYLTSLWTNDNDGLSGSETNDKWWPANIGQVIPPVYDQYRLVSASIVVKYIGRLDIASGVIGGAIVFDESPVIGAGYTQDVDDNYSANPNLAKYGNFDLAMDSFYHQENLCLEGMRMLYFPIDNSYEEYVRISDGSHIKQTWSGDPINTPLIFSSDQDYYKSGFNWLVYVLGAPANSTCFKVDVYCNYECLPNASFLNYLPLSMSTMHVSAEEKRKANLIVQQKPVMKINDKETSIVPYVPNIWEKLEKKFAGALPSIGKLVAKGIVSMVPALKPGIALASAFLGANSQSNAMEQENI